VLGGRALCDSLRYNKCLTALELSGSDVLLETLQAVGAPVRGRRPGRSV
jgi:hypothetical protein